MRFVFKDHKLEQLYTHQKGKKRYPPEVIRSFFRVMFIISSASDERDLLALRGLNYEALKANEVINIRFD